MWVVTVDELQDQMAKRYAALDLPAWPDPHPDRSPRDEEYSRLTDPERYRIVHARARVWTELLGELPDVEVETLAPGPLADRRDGFDRGVRITSSRPGTLPLCLLERDVTSDGASLAVLHLAVVRPQMELGEAQPDCGCDACDSGSDDLLSAIDESVVHVVGGPFVVLRGDGWHAEWHPEGGSATGHRGGFDDFRELMDRCRRLADGQDVRLPKHTEAFVGRSWLS